MGIIQIVKRSWLISLSNICKSQSLEYSFDMFLAIIGISLEITGFVFMINSTRRLVLRQGGFTSDQHVDPTTGQPPPEIEGPPIPHIYRPAYTWLSLA